MVVRVSAKHAAEEALLERTLVHTRLAFPVRGEGTWTSRSEVLLEALAHCLAESEAGKMEDGAEAVFQQRMSVWVLDQRTRDGQQGGLEEDGRDEGAE
jgi:hypothetical protein